MIRGMMAALALSSSAFPALAAAEDRIVDTGNIQTVAALMREAGYKAEIKKSDDGRTYIKSAAGGSDFQVRFYGCKGDTGCGSYEFFSYYKKESFFSAALANDWNATKRFLKVAVDSDGDLSEFLYVSSLGKATYANFVDTIEWYAEMDAELNRFLKARRDGAGKPVAAK